MDTATKEEPAFTGSVSKPHQGKPAASAVPVVSYRDVKKIIW